MTSPCDGCGHVHPTTQRATFGPLTLCRVLDGMPAMLCDGCYSLALSALLADLAGEDSLPDAPTVVRSPEPPAGARAN